jgi:hypothetical protein
MPLRQISGTTAVVPTMQTTDFRLICVSYAPIPS